MSVYATRRLQEPGNRSESATAAQRLNIDDLGLVSPDRPLMKEKLIVSSAVILAGDFAPFVDTGAETPRPASASRGRPTAERT